MGNYFTYFIKSLQKLLNQYIISTDSKYILAGNVNKLLKVSKNLDFPLLIAKNGCNPELLGRFQNIFYSN